MLYIILLVFTVISLLYGVYFAAISLAGFFHKRRPNPYARPCKRIAALVPARNEEKVIGYLVESLVRQQYPRELYDIYVIVNNCSDDTRGAAERAGAKIIDCDREVHSKGEVLRFAFEQLELPGAAKHDAYCIFDADNLVDAGFMQAANNALCAGYHIAQAYRDSKNPGGNWVAGCTSTFFWFMSRLYNASRANLGMSTNLNGTGIVISAELLAKLGYNVTSLTEDLEYTAKCLLAGYRIGWMEDAVIYDEQPTSFKDSFVQRRRWGAGSLQCAHLYLTKLLKKAIFERDLDCLDLALLFMGMYVQAISLMPSILTIAVCVLRIRLDPVAGLHQAIGVAATGLLGGMLAGIAFVYILGAMEKKLNKVTLSTFFLMCIYLLSWIPANLVSLFTRPPKWTSIQHESAIDIDHCEAINGLPGEKEEQPKLRDYRETGM